MADVLIAQCDVFRNPGARRDVFPMVVILQADAIHQTSSVVVAPLVAEGIVSASRLTPVFHIEDRDWTLVISDLATVPRRQLTERVTSLAASRDRIVAALDLLFLGF